MTRILWTHQAITHSTAKVTLLLLGLILTLHLVLHNYAAYQDVTNSFPFIPRHSFSEFYDTDSSQRPFRDDSNSNSNGTASPPLTCHGQSAPPQSRANATMLMLARNSDLFPALASVKAIQDRFNNLPGHQYPWVFLNEEPFTADFQHRMRDAILGPAPPEGRSKEEEAHVEFGLIPRDHWFQPDWIDEDKATRGRWDLTFKGIIYADSVSYRNMCRFNSGFFYRHELLQKYKWYWRVEPGVNFFCDIDEDPFLFMERNNKTYGFTISMEEFRETIPSLWGTVKDFVKENPQFVAENNAMGFLSSNDGEEYNLCHFWSNFEIVSMDFFRSPAYTAYFSALDATGNFYYERWGDAPVHSIAAGLLLDKQQLHFFSDIGYRHDPFQHCPQGESNSKGRCSCDPKDNYDYTGASCLRRWEAIFE